MPYHARGLPGVRQAARAVIIWNREKLEALKAEVASSDADPIVFTDTHRGKVARYKFPRRHVQRTIEKVEDMLKVPQRTFPENREGDEP